MKKVMSCFMFCFSLFIALSSIEALAEDYDNFKAGAINRDKWQNREFVRVIDGDSLRLEVRGAPWYSGNYIESAISAKRSSEITRISARIDLRTYDNDDDAFGAARICGRFYNDGTSGDGFEGDIFASIELGGTSSSPRARWFVGRINNDSSPWGVSEAYSDDFSTDIRTGTYYDVEIEWDGEMFTFKLDGEERTFQPPWPVREPAHYPDKFLDVLIFPPDQNATVSARFDNVRGWNKNGTRILSDDFSSATIDRTKWRQYEYVRRIENGKLRLTVRSDTGYTNPVESTLIFKNPEDITYMETEIRPTTFQNNGADSVRAGLFGRFLNDGTRGSGYLGDIGAIVGIGGSDSSPKGVWYVIRHTDSDDSSQSEVIGSGTFDVSIKMGTDYTISVGLVGDFFVFRIRKEDKDWETRYFQTGASRPARMPFKALQTRIKQYDGSRATVSALFDNVKTESKFAVGSGILITIDGMDPIATFVPGKTDYWTHYLYNSITDTFDSPKWFKKITEHVGPIIPFEWSRDIDLIQGELWALRDLIKGFNENKRPVTILSHSWGTVLSYMVLRKYSNIKVDRLITLGSPLESDKDSVYDLTNYVLVWNLIFDRRKPSNLDVWHNYVVECDPIAGEIKAAKNYINEEDYGKTCHAAYYEDEEYWADILADVIKN